MQFICLVMPLLCKDRLFFWERRMYPLPTNYSTVTSLSRWHPPVGPNWCKSHCVLSWKRILNRQRFVFHFKIHLYFFAGHSWWNALFPTFFQLMDSIHEVLFWKVATYPTKVALISSFYSISFTDTNFVL